MAALACGSIAHALDCNTRSGQIADQPALPTLLTARQVEALPTPELDVDLSDNRALELKLESDIDSLVSMAGPHTTNVPILGVRLENYPQFDPKKHCNRVAVSLVKPRIVKVGDGRWRATWDRERFSLPFTARTLLDAWTLDTDPSQRMVWIFPATFGKKRDKGTPWNITRDYDLAFRAAPKGSAQRRWIGEAYLNLVLRTYRQARLSEGFPRSHHVKRSSLDEHFESQEGVSCASGDSTHLICLISDLIELNETGRSGRPYFSDDAFRTGDALWINSGISTGIRQLDFSTVNAQAAKVSVALLPHLFANSTAGYGWRRPIRQWELDTLNGWYDGQGPEANKTLSQPDAQKKLLESHADFVIESAKHALPRVMATYRTWPLHQQIVLALIATDLENVSGYRLQYPARASYYCAVLADSTPAPKSKRSNRGVVQSHKDRVLNAERLVRERFNVSDIDECWGQTP